jgi:hypothetical protein
MLIDPFTGEPSIPFTLYAMECEGEFEEEEDIDDSETDEPS